MSFKISLNNTDCVFEANAEETILNAANRQHISLPYSCKGGTCGSCKGLIISGKIAYKSLPPQALEKHEQQQGMALLCQAHANSDLKIDIRRVKRIESIPVRLLPARVVSHRNLAPDVLLIRLKVPTKGQFQFLPGQYIDLFTQNGSRRSFSIANTPGEDEIELHIRLIEGGGFTHFLFGQLKDKAIIRIEGPLGTFVLDDDKNRPIVMMGGGTGFAPLKSMLESLLAKGLTQAVSLYWGARAKVDLYQHDLALQWAKNNATIRYIPVLSDPQESDNWSGLTGFVHQAVINNWQEHSDCNIYMSGPPIMIKAAQADFLEQGIDPSRLFFDSFEFATDTLARMNQKQ